MSSTVARHDRRQYFCDHCKVLGHSIQRCFKVHGYPPGHILYNKNRKVVATVQAEHIGSNAETPQASFSQPVYSNPQAFSNSVPVPRLTAEQYAQLMALL